MANLTRTVDGVHYEIEGYLFGDHQIDVVISLLRQANQNFGAVQSRWKNRNGVLIVHDRSGREIGQIPTDKGYDGTAESCNWVATGPAILAP
jgi:hypothetical protein